MFFHDNILTMRGSRMVEGVLHSNKFTH